MAGTQELASIVCITYDLLQHLLLSGDNYHLSLVIPKRSRAMQSGNGRGVQQADVSAAADVLLAQGQRPTVERLRQHLGRGSPNTVGPMLETWFAGLATRLGVHTTESDAAGTPTDIRQAMDKLWRLAVDLARKDAQAAVAAEHDLLRAHQNQLSEERNELGRESAALAERDTLRNAALERAQGQVDDLAQQLRNMQTSLQQRESELGSVRASLARAVEAKDAAQVEHQQSIQTLTEERRRLEERFSATERRHLEEVDRARQEAKSTKKLLMESEERNAALRKDWEEALQLANVQIQVLKTESAELRVSLVASDKRIRDLRDLAVISRKNAATKRPRRTKSAA